MNFTDYCVVRCRTFYPLKTLCASVCCFIILNATSNFPCILGEQEEAVDTLGWVDILSAMSQLKHVDPLYLKAMNMNHIPVTGINCRSVLSAQPIANKGSGLN